jgi:hypothetical protein
MHALGGEDLFAAANREAVKLVKAHWREITQCGAIQRALLTAPSL